MELNIERLMTELFEQFKKIDDFRNDFKDEFNQAMIKSFNIPSDLSNKEETKRILNVMAEETISFTEAIIDKDRNYSEYRKEEELHYMSKLLDKQAAVIKFNGESEQLKSQLSTLILKHYPAIYELSAFGFRLLERNIQFYTNEFIITLHNALNEKKDD